MATAMGSIARRHRVGTQRVAAGCRAQAVFWRVSSVCQNVKNGSILLLLLLFLLFLFLLLFVLLLYHLNRWTSRTRLLIGLQS